MFLNKKIIPALIALNIITLPLTGFSQELKNQTLQKEFKIDLYPNGKLFIQRDPNFKHTTLPDWLVLQYQNNAQTQQEIIENGLSEDTQILFVFSEKIDKNIYLFVMTKNKKIDKKERTDGYEYSLHTFVQDSHHKLQLAIIADNNDPNIENDKIGDHLFLDGFEGILNGSKKTFEYKTPESIKEYLKTSIVHGPLKTDFYPEGKIYFEGKSNILTYPIAFILEYNDKGQTKKETIDQYEPDSGGGIYTPATINSVFTYSIQQKSYIFVIVSWDIDFVASAGGGSNDYKIYSYTKNNNGLLKQDKNMIQNPQFSGSEGNIIYSNNEDHDKDIVIPVKFNYTTADALKKYLDQTYNFAIIQGPFETVLYPEGKIYFQAQESGYQTPVNFVLEYNQNGQPKKETIDQYKPNHVAAEIASVFTYPIHQKPYIFTIVKWSARPETSNGRYGYFYKVYGYTKDQNNNLKLDQNVSNDPKLSGFIGANIYKNKEEITFKYETAGKLKKYLNQKYNKSLSSK